MLPCGSVSVTYCQHLPAKNAYLGLIWSNDEFNMLQWKPQNKQGITNVGLVWPLKQIKVIKKYKQHQLGPYRGVGVRAANAAPLASQGCLWTPYCRKYWESPLPEKYIPWVWPKYCSVKMQFHGRSKASSGTAGCRWRRAGGGPSTQTQLCQSNLVLVIKAKQGFHVWLPHWAHLLPANTADPWGRTTWSLLGLSDQQKKIALIMVSMLYLDQPERTHFAHDHNQYDW